MKYDVFLSYSRADGGKVEKIYEALTRSGLSVFFDKESIRYETFPKAIAEGILSSKVFLFIASENSINSNYAPDEITFAKGHKPRNSIIVYKIDDSIFPSDIELLFSSLNYRDASVDSIKILIEDCNQLVSQGQITRTPKVTKDTSIDDSFKELWQNYSSMYYYQVIYVELKNGYWKSNWNHHFLLMLSYKAVGDRKNYSILLEQYDNARILYYPKWCDFSIQVWDMIKFGFTKIALAHYNYGNPKLTSDLEKICYRINRNHLLLLGENKVQEAINNYIDVLKELSQNNRYSILIKDFNTLRWIGNYQLSDKLLENITRILGYTPQSLYTTPVSSEKYENILQKLEAHTWHVRENRVHISLRFQSFNGAHTSTYYFEEYSKNIIGTILGALPFGLDESDKLLKNGRAFCQYRINKVDNHYIIEEYDPIREVVYSGEILKLTNSDLHIRIIYNGVSSMANTVRKFKSK